MAVGVIVAVAVLVTVLAMPSRAEEKLPAHPKLVYRQIGAGYTLASGTSSCAAAAAAHRAGLIDREVVVTMPGGELEVRIADDGEIWLRGPAEEVASGDFSPELLRRLAHKEGP